MTFKTADKDHEPQGILLVNKPQGKTSFSLIKAIRKKIGMLKVGHAGTLDPFAKGVMILLIGRKYTQLSDTLRTQGKEYRATVHLGITTDTYDCDGKIVGRSKKEPSLEEVQQALTYFQGQIEQVPPMFSAKKVMGKRLYVLARQGKEISRPAALVTLETTLIKYEYPNIYLQISCSKGTYIRSIAHELGLMLGCGAHLIELERTRSGSVLIEDCIDGSLLFEDSFVLPRLIQDATIFCSKSTIAS